MYSDSPKRLVSQGSEDTESSQHQNCSPFGLIAGTIFQAIVGVWLPLLFNFSILYGFGFSHALSGCRLITSFCWVALIAMIWNRCEIFFAYSLVLTSIFLSPPLGSRVSRTSIYLSVCGGATPALVSRFLSQESLVDYKFSSFKNQEQMLLRLLAYLKRSSSLWLVLIFVCEGASTFCFIKALFGFEGDLIFSPPEQQHDEQFAHEYEFWVFIPLIPLLLASFPSLVAWFVPDPIAEDIEASSNEPRKGGKNAFRSVLLITVGIFLVDYGFDILYSLLPPFRDSFMNNIAFIFAFRLVVLALLCAKCYQLKLNDGEVEENRNGSFSCVHGDSIELNGSVKYKLNAAND